MSNSSGDMHPLAPPPHRQHDRNISCPPRRLQNSASPFNTFSVTKQGIIPRTPASSSASPYVKLLYEPRNTHPLVWCSAFMCLVFCLLVIFFGIATLIMFLVIRPRYPSIDISSATLNAIYFGSPENFNGDFTLFVNFTNPNKKITVKFDYLDVKLYFVNRLIATQALEPFTQRPREARLEMVHLTSSLVYMPPNPAIEVQRQVQSNQVKYDIRGAFRVRAKVGIARFSYWLHTKCHLEMTSPPSGKLLARTCTTKR